MPPVPKRPPVARERVIPRMPDGPPWKLISPTGVRHVIEDRKAIKTFCEEMELDVFNINHLLGETAGNTAQSLHVNFWQPQHLFLFLKRHDGGRGAGLGVVGGPGKGRTKGESGVNHFIKVVAAHRSDMSFTEQNRDKLQQLLVGTYTSNSVPSNNFKGWGLAFPATEGYAPARPA